MTVYVDDMFLTATVGRITSQWCHLTADTEEELHEFAQRIGLRRAWFQDKGRHSHYDVTRGLYWKAVRAGAVRITWREMGEMVMARRETGTARPAAGPPPPAPRVPGDGHPAVWEQPSLFQQKGPGS